LGLFQKNENKMNECNLGFRYMLEENEKKLGVCKALGWFLLKGVMFSLKSYV
jgi:hypothetical protein